MAGVVNNGQDVLAKVVLTGIPDSGKGALLRHMARRHAHDSVRVGEVDGGAVYRTEFYWPEELKDGRRLRVRLFALSGRPTFNAVSELLLAGCDGLVFVADVQPDRLAEVQAAFRGVIYNAGRSGIDLKRLPLVMQYHYRGVEPGFDPDRMDQCLGITPGEVERVTIRFSEEDQAGCVGVEQVLRRIVREACPEQNMIEA